LDLVHLLFNFPYWKQLDALEFLCLCYTRVLFVSVVLEQLNLGSYSDCNVWISD
jgi:hypothetical protein